MNKLLQFLKEVKVELSKVVWPSRKDAIKLTLIVIFFSVFVALFLGGIDYGLSRLIDYIIRNKTY